jgi:hypothetical protein
MKPDHIDVELIMAPSRSSTIRCVLVPLGIRRTQLRHVPKDIETPLDKLGMVAFSCKPLIDTFVS